MAFNQKVALVLGGIKGIGKAIALSFAQQGIKLILTYYDWEEHLDSLVTDLKINKADFLLVKINLLKTEQIKNLVSQAIEKYGQLDIFINNIERGGWPVVHGPYNQEQWDLEMHTTLRAKWWVFNEMLPHLKKAKNANVINISSIAGIVGRSGPASFVFNDAYAAANRGISLLTETWARIGAPEIRVNELMLGLFATRHAQETRGWGALTDSQKQAIISHTLLGRTGSPQDVVKAVNYVIRDAPYLTGSVIRLDGGYALGGEKVLPMPDGIL